MWPLQVTETLEPKPTTSSPGQTLALFVESQAPDLDPTPAESLGRLSQALLRRPLTTSEYVAVQDLVDLAPPPTSMRSLQLRGDAFSRCVALLCALGEAAHAQLGGVTGQTDFEVGLGFFAEVRRSWR
ncbi:MAG: hypothetical protein U0228_23450 [Myxococcaceae bacterium]